MTSFIPYARLTTFLMLAATAACAEEAATENESAQGVQYNEIHTSDSTLYVNSTVCYKIDKVVGAGRYRVDELVGYREVDERDGVTRGFTYAHISLEDAWNPNTPESLVLRLDGGPTQDGTTSNGWLVSLKKGEAYAMMPSMPHPIMRNHSSLYGDILFDWDAEHRHLTSFNFPNPTPYDEVKAVVGRAFTQCPDQFDDFYRYGEPMPEPGTTPAPENNAQEPVEEPGDGSED